MELISFSSAQVKVTGISYGSTTDGADQTNGNLLHTDVGAPVTSVWTATSNYQFIGPSATNVAFRRGSTGSNNSTIFYQYSATGTPNTVTAGADGSPTINDVMMSGDLTQGLRNPFSNTGGTTGTDSNIERIDFYLPNYTVQAGDAMVFFDLENANNFGDGFRIAAFTSLGTVNGVANSPNAYANTGLLVAADSFGNVIPAPDGSNAQYLRSTTTAGDNLTGTQTIATVDSNSGASTELYLVGILIRFSDLGIAANTVIQGFSLMAGDVTPTNAASLVNWTTTSVYRNNTNASTYGNMDFMGFGASIARPVIPEPSTYGAILMATLGSLVAVRRHWRTLKSWAKARRSV